MRKYKIGYVLSLSICLLGILLNQIVVRLNGGMPVDSSWSARLVQLAEGRVLSHAGTKLLFLGDVIYFPGLGNFVTPHLYSIGDIVMFLALCCAITLFGVFVYDFCKLIFKKSGTFLFNDTPKVH